MFKRRSVVERHCYRRHVCYTGASGSHPHHPMPKQSIERVRLSARIPGRLRDTLEQAAELQGATLNPFVV